MDESPSIPRRIDGIKRLAREYFDMEYAAPIESPSKLIHLFDIRGSKYKKHPGTGAAVYISHKSLKHFVETRKIDLEKRHPKEEVIERIMFMLDHLQETIINYEHYEQDRTRKPIAHFYTKDYFEQRRPLLGILLDEKEDSLEIRSIHFKT